MKKLVVSSNVKNSITVFITFLFLVTSSVVHSQNPANFSGKWILNNSKSSEILTNLSSTVIISQIGNVVNFEITNTPKNGHPVTIKEKYVLGEGMGGRSSYHNLIRLADWSSDKQTISLTYLISFDKNGSIEEWKYVTVYSLADEGKTMKVRSEHVLLEGTITPDSERNMVYDKSL